MVQQQFWRAAAAAASGRSLPVFVAAAATIGSSLTRDGDDDDDDARRHCRLGITDCSAAPAPAATAQQQQQQQQQHYGDQESTNTVLEGFQPKAEGYYADLFPKRQLWHPKLEYPQWDLNWDGRHPATTGDETEDRRRLREIRKNGITRHIILIRHGQYEEGHREDELRKLTPTGKVQAELTGKRLAEILAGDDFGPLNVKAVRVSGMTRAKETAEIIAAYLPGVPLVEPDPLLSEGRPCHHIPGIRATEKSIHLTDEHHPRIEKAFQKYFYRSLEFPQQAKDDDAAAESESAAAATRHKLDIPPPPPPPHHHYLPDSGGGGVTMTRMVSPPGVVSIPPTIITEENQKHEFEIIVCHANVIRYFLCRALQLPPEAWLRYCPFNCSMTYLTIRPSGNVSCRMLGDIGHLPYGSCTFSKHRGFNW